MGFRFRKSIKLFKGVNLNLNKDSVGISIGTRGARYSVNSKGKRTATIGIPGTGLSYTQSLSKGKCNSSRKTSNSNAKAILNKGEQIVKTLNTTDNPTTFFEHVEIYRDFLNSIQIYYDNKTIIGVSPKEQLENFNKVLPSQINLFINRYAEKTEIKLLNLKTESAKINNLNIFLNNLNYYSKNMSNENIDLYNKIYQDLTDKYILNLNKTQNLYCSYCGEKIDSDSKFCSFCGKKLKN